MEAETNFPNFSQTAPHIFDEENYQLWAVEMETYLEALDLWEAVEEDYEVAPLPKQSDGSSDDKPQREEDQKIKGQSSVVC